MGENWIESSWSGLTLEEKLAWLTNNLYWLKINMDVNDNKFIKMYNELKSNFEDFSLYINNNINTINNNINAINNNINAINKNINAINKNINEKSNIMENKVVIVQLHNSNNQEYDRIYLDPDASYFINVVTSRGNIFTGESKINTIFIQDSENDKYDNVSIDFYSKETSGAFRDMKLSVYFELSKSVEGYNYMIRMVIWYLNTDTNKWETTHINEDDAKKLYCKINIVKVDTKEVI